MQHEQKDDEGSLDAVLGLSVRDILGNVRLVFLHGQVYITLYHVFDTGPLSVLNLAIIFRSFLLRLFGTFQLFEFLCFTLLVIFAPLDHLVVPVFDLFVVDSLVHLPEEDNQA